jgi:hypothetical protein
MNIADAAHFNYIVGTCLGQVNVPEQEGRSTGFGLAGMRQAEAALSGMLASYMKNLL